MSIRLFCVKLRRHKYFLVWFEICWDFSTLQIPPYSIDSQRSKTFILLVLVKISALHTASNSFFFFLCENPVPQKKRHSEFSRFKRLVKIIARFKLFWNSFNEYCSSNLLTCLYVFMVRIKLRKLIWINEIEMPTYQDILFLLKTLVLTWTAVCTCSVFFFIFCCKRKFVTFMNQ